MLNRKGDATDILLFLVIIFFLAVSFIVVIFANVKIQQVISDSDLNDSSASEDILEAFDIINTKTVQNGFVLMFAILIIGMLVSAFLIRVHPIFFFFYIITAGFGIFLAVILSNIYQRVIENPQLATVAVQQGMINYVMQNIIAILIGAWALSMIILFGKLFAGGGGLGASEDVVA